MKKTLLPLFLLGIALASCGGTPSTSDYTLDLKVAAPAGAPVVPLFRHINSENLEVNADPANVIAYFSASSNKDVIIAPTNAGLKAIQSTSAPYKIAATITFGNFYFAGTGHDENKTLDPSDYVVVFQKNNVPDKLFQYVYGDTGLTNVHYVTAASDAATCLISGKNISDNNAEVDYVLMAEPALNNALSKNANAYEYASIQEEFKKKSGGKEITQASVFVSSSLEKAKADAFLNALEQDVNAFLNNPKVLETYIVSEQDQKTAQSKFSAPVAMLEKMASSNNRMGLGYKKAVDNKEAIKNFVSLFGINSIDEETYYK